LTRKVETLENFLKIHNVTIPQVNSIQYASGSESSDEICTSEDEKMVNNQSNSIIAVNETSQNSPTETVAGSNGSNGVTMAT